MSAAQLISSTLCERSDKDKHPPLPVPCYSVLVVSTYHHLISVIYAVRLYIPVGSGQRRHIFECIPNRGFLHCNSGGSVLWVRANAHLSRVAGRQAGLNNLKTTLVKTYICVGLFH